MSAEELISIHAPSMGSDPCGGRYTRILRNFNPRSPWGERHSASCSRTYSAIFQSTLPAWGATQRGHRSQQEKEISIHAPRMGSDNFPGSRQPHRYGISIHAPRMGSDFLYGGYGVLSIDFNPRSPHGERHLPTLASRLFLIRFQSTLPAWGATSSCHMRYKSETISIHAPRMGSDDPDPILFTTIIEFQSTLPAWGATAILRIVDRSEVFQSTLPAWGATSIGCSEKWGDKISIHAPRMGSDSQSDDNKP